LLITVLVLTVLDNGYKFQIEIDALEYAIGEVLSQKQSDNF